MPRQHHSGTTGHGRGLSCKASGVALIVTLAILTLLTILLVTFVSVMTQDRNATANYVQVLRADQIALSGLDQIVSQLQAEVTDTKNSTVDGGSGIGTNAFYVPKASTNAVPQRMVSQTLFPIVTLSGTNVYASATNFAARGSVTTNAALNGRTVGMGRWEKPAFLGASAAKVFAASPPQWIVVTRGGPVGFPAGTTPAAAGLVDTGSANMKTAVGRYAYVVYDTSGLLDINVAGYPNAAASYAVTNKGLLPWADLSQITNTISTNDVDALVKWRNATNYNSYAGYVTNWATNGFLRVAPGDTAFLGRQELIKYAQTQRPALTNALPYLTTFSREVNGPVWGPTTNLGIVNASNYNYQVNATNSGTLNPLVFHPRVTTSGWPRNNGVPAVKNEPLVKYRFPLSKLALLESVGTTYSVADYTGNKNNIKSDILKYFGLVLASDSNGLYRHWVYTNPSGNSPTTGATTILPLDTVAGLNREADFFELLKAGILNGSLGKTGRGDTVAGVGYYTLYPPTGWVDPDSQRDYQIIRIGANIADQWDTDDYPTTITFGGENFYGIEDLPYISKMLVKVNGSGAVLNPSSTVPTPQWDYYLYFELWNPHQVSGASGGAPSQFQIVPVSGTVQNDFYSIGVAAVSSPLSTPIWYYPSTGGWGAYSSSSAATRYFSALSGGGAFSFSVASVAASSAYREPTVIPSPTSTAAWTGGPSILALPLGSIPSFPPNGTAAFNNAYTWKNTATGSTATTTNTQAVLTRNCAMFRVNAAFQIQFQDPSGAWRTYGTFEGLADGGIKTGYWMSDVLTPCSTLTTADTDAYVKSDPRTFRFGLGDSIPTSVAATASGFTAAAGVSLNPDATTVNAPCYGSLTPFVSIGSLSAAAPYRIDLWSVNASAVTPSGAASTASGAPYYTDPDGAQRPGDARYAYPAASPFFTGASSARPVILNHRFTSVGDLGYVFRDVPWKTLDLFSSSSADAGLLDLFTLDDARVVAGRINPNTAPASVLKALLSGAQLNPSGSTSLSSSAASGIAGAIYATATNSPFLTRADVVPALVSSSVVTNQIPSGIKVEREAVIRALAESSNTRTWNFLIDVIAQAGRYPATASSLDNFMVTGERRYWLHIAIDRYTGQVVDRQLEAVQE